MSRDAYEDNLIKNACDMTGDRKAAKSELLKHIWNKYLALLIRYTQNFENKLRGIKLPDSPEDTCKDFITWVIKEDKLCHWKQVSVKTALTIMLNSYLTDIMRKHSKLSYETDEHGNKVKDEYGDYKIKDVKNKAPILKNCERLLIPTGDKEEDIIENPSLYKNIKHDSHEQKLIDNLMLEKIKKIQKKALMELQTINNRNADIIYMEIQKVSREEIARKLTIEKSGVNTTVNRAYSQYIQIYYKLLREEGIETKISEDKLKGLLIGVTRDQN